MLPATWYTGLKVNPRKPPSWWVHDIRIVLDFRDVNGMWLQTDLVSTANVRLLGQHTMVSRDMEYKMIGLEVSGATISAVPQRSR